MSVRHRLLSAVGYQKYLQLPGSNRYPSPQSSERSPFEAEAERPEATRKIPGTPSRLQT